MSRIGSRKDRLVIDSSAWIEYFAGGPLADEFARYIERSTPKTTYTPAIVVYEVYNTIKRDLTEEEAIVAVSHMEERSTIMDVDIRAALKGADTSIDERLPMADSLILGMARMRGARVVTGDAHFKDLDDAIYIE